MMEIRASAFGLRRYYNGSGLKVHSSLLNVVLHDQRQCRDDNLAM
jgi:hypothetical protein